jgi:hypothetical protein
MTRTRYKFGLLFGILLMAVLSCHAENCQWLNAATAGGAIGGTITSKLVQHTTADDTTCQFIRKQGEAVSTLEIAVHTVAAPEKDYQNFRASCGAATTPLKGVGNEAVECTLHDKPNMTTEQVVARVRNRVFLLKWTMPATRDGTAAPSHEDLHDIIQNLAEQVAGSLF